MRAGRLGARRGACSRRMAASGDSRSAEARLPASGPPPGASPVRSSARQRPPARAAQDYGVSATAPRRVFAAPHARGQPVDTPAASGRVGLRAESRRSLRAGHLSACRRAHQGACTQHACERRRCLRAGHLSACLLAHRGACTQHTCERRRCLRKDHLSARRRPPGEASRPPPP